MWSPRRPYEDRIDARDAHTREVKSVSASTLYRQRTMARLEKDYAKHLTVLEVSTYLPASVRDGHRGGSTGDTTDRDDHLLWTQRCCRRNLVVDQRDPGQSPGLAEKVDARRQTPYADGRGLGGLG